MLSKISSITLQRYDTSGQRFATGLPGSFFPFNYFFFLPIGDEFYVHGSVHRDSLSIIVQQDATIYSLLYICNRSTCFGWYLHPSSRAHITVVTASGTGQTVSATFRYREVFGIQQIRFDQYQML